MAKSHNAGLQVADKIAISAACGGGALIIITYLIPDKTPVYTGLLLAILLVMVSYPILHFVRHPRLKWGLAIFSCSMIFVFGWSVWPKPKSDYSDLRIEESQLHDLVSGKELAINLWIFNDSSHTIRAKQFGVLDISGPIASLDEERAIENEKWKIVEYTAATTNSSITQVFPPKVKTWSTLTDARAVVSAEQADGLLKGTGQVSVRFLMALVYADDVGEHELDYCVLLQHYPVLQTCYNGRNGPSKPMKHKQPLD